MTRKLLAAATFLLACALIAPAARAQDENANCRNLEHPPFSGWASHAQMGQKLAQIEQTSKGRVDVEVIGRSNRGRKLYAARVGTGDRVMLVTSAIHGNEKTGTEALLHWLQHIGSSNTAETKALLAGITFVAVPMFNPDGGELEPAPERLHVGGGRADATEFPEDTPPAWYYSGGAGGFDVNRDFTPNLDYEPRAQDMPGADALPGLLHDARVEDAARALHRSA